MEKRKRTCKAADSERTIYEKILFRLSQEMPHSIGDDTRYSTNVMAESDIPDFVSGEIRK